MGAGTTRQGGPALVFSSSRDQANTAPVVRRLEDAGLRAVVLCFDEILAGRQQLAVELDRGTERIVVDGERFAVADVVAAWWRKPNWVEVERPDPLLRASLELECERSARAVAGLLPDHVWLNAPDAIRAAEGKLRQLSLAARYGFGVPQTVVANTWPAVDALAERTPVVFKSFRGVVQTGAENRIVFTTPLVAEELNRLRESAAPWPGIFQAKIAGGREWRVTVVGDRVLPVAVALADDLVDWRRHQLTDAVRFTLAELDPPRERACLQVVRALGLGYAALDLIEDADGKLWFLEANANGQYGWLEHELGLPVSEAIAHQLAAIARGPLSAAARRPARA